MLNIPWKRTQPSTEHRADEQLLKDTVQNGFASQEVLYWWLFSPLPTLYFHPWPQFWDFLSAQLPQCLWVSIPQTSLQELWLWIPVTSFRCNPVMSFQRLLFRFIDDLTAANLPHWLFLPYSSHFFQLWLLPIFRWLPVVPSIIFHIQQMLCKSLV